MAVPRFFIDEPYAHQVLVPGTRTSLTSDTSAYHHVVNVLRLTADKRVEIVQRGVWTAWLCKIESIDANQVLLEVVEEIKSVPLLFETTLLLGFSKGDTNEKVIRQATELGVTRVIPVLFDRSVSRPDQKRAKSKIERLRKIAVSAAQQAHRRDLPIIEDLHGFSEALDLLTSLQLDVTLVPWEEETDKSFSAYLEGLTLSEYPRVALVIGPEGGITQGEILALQDLGAQSVSLGPTILRVDTAVCASLAITHDILAGKHIKGDA
ncbi:MAG: 16S rRNA (uracil(1498)-N(3))-methyltransferase [Coriobacteriia bacterium]|nr:16S rRNA (uracil(1498)-N(3))-methyltransferase [Coriobacteriia bacterium]MCL2746444.1 16S rRNA (uracil(1498)-N(3))-methyltransferase [Coriobacteriia bacterium]MCL2870690.1 16S rRNA (uracil(1498)-N(3))-methyltransferase [Coriobacteriia bacterium]